MIIIWLFSNLTGYGPNVQTINTAKLPPRVIDSPMSQTWNKY